MSLQDSNRKVNLSDEQVSTLKRGLLGRFLPKCFNQAAESLMRISNPSNSFHLTENTTSRP